MNFCTNSSRRGQVMVNESGATGVVTHETQYYDSGLGRYRTRYFGVTFNGREWESKDPYWLNDNLADYLKSRHPKATPVSS